MPHFETDYSPLTIFRLDAMRCAHERWNENLPSPTPHFLPIYFQIRHPRPKSPQLANENSSPLPPTAQHGFHGYTDEGGRLIYPCILVKGIRVVRHLPPTTYFQVRQHELSLTTFALALALFDVLERQRS